MGRQKKAKTAASLKVSYSVLAVCGPSITDIECRRDVSAVEALTGFVAGDKDVSEIFAARHNKRDIWCCGNSVRLS